MVNRVATTLALLNKRLAAAKASRDQYEQDGNAVAAAESAADVWDFERQIERWEKLGEATND